MKIDFEKCGGLIPVIAQDWQSGEILMLAYTDQEAFDETVATGRAVYFSRSRGKLWRKGEQSGNFQIVKEILVDCDRDSLVYKIEQIGGAACHTGHRSCFYTALQDGRETELYPPVFNPDEVYGKK